jgi:hypothetical protein
MREHIGIDVDALDDENIRVHDTPKVGHGESVWEPDAEQRYGQKPVTEKSHHAERAKNMMRDATDAIRQGEI